MQAACGGGEDDSDEPGAAADDKSTPRASLHEALAQGGMRPDRAPLIGKAQQDYEYM